MQYVDLDIDNIEEGDEEDPGGFLVKGGDKKQITLDSNMTEGNVTLTRNNSKIKIFTSSGGETEITFNGRDNVFQVNDLPKSLYVQGVQASDQDRDIMLSLTHDITGAYDNVRLTVIGLILDY